MPEDIEDAQRILNLCCALLETSNLSTAARLAVVSKLAGRVRQEAGVPLDIIAFGFAKLLCEDARGTPCGPADVVDMVRSGALLDAERKRAGSGG